MSGTFLCHYRSQRSLKSGCKTEDRKNDAAVPFREGSANAIKSPANELCLRLKISNGGGEIAKCGGRKKNTVFTNVARRATAASTKKSQATIRLLFPEADRSYRERGRSKRGLWEAGGKKGENKKTRGKREGVKVRERRNEAEKLEQGTKKAAWWPENCLGTRTAFDAENRGKSNKLQFSRVELRSKKLR